jgi:hypothetical protein
VNVYKDNRIVNGNQTWLGKILSSYNNKILVPFFKINSQTLVDGSDIGNTIFQISDEFKYYNSKTIIIPNHKCDPIYINPEDIKITIFNKDCILILSVLRGTGTLLDRIYNLSGSINNVEFGENLIKYSLFKYLLARILYEDFNVNYLLVKYNDKFLDDLSNSRFCGTVPFFTTGPLSSYIKYFRYKL